MLKTIDEIKEEQTKAVFGYNYDKAKSEMQVLAQQLKDQANIGFSCEEECALWAKEHNLDNVAFSPSGKQFYNISHKGELIRTQSYISYYSNILFYKVTEGNKFKKVIWKPDSFEYLDKARIPGEVSDGTHEALYYRDYTRPTGYYNNLIQKFNIAKPFPYFAKKTGRDTSHIYTYIKHIAGECYMWLLAWLRAKMVHPTTKTQVIPIIVSRSQGSGKSSFGEVICKGLFGADNVLVTDQYDSQARFNSDYADALIVCMEEKEETDRRNPVATLKSRATATTVRKELKGIDPIYQESYTDFIMTTNKDVPIKFDGREDQRRFMIMQADENFTRKTSKEADEIFSKLYGFDANGNQVCTPFVEDKELIQQFKYELFARTDIRDIPLRNFPKTAAYNRCFTLPRTSEATEIESILKAIAPFIKASLEQKKCIVRLASDGNLSDTVQYISAMEYRKGENGEQDYIALCRPLIFNDMQTGKPYAHATVERGLLDSRDWLADEFGLELLPNAESLPNGFTGLNGRYKASPAARFILKAEKPTEPEEKRFEFEDNPCFEEVDVSSFEAVSFTEQTEERIGKRLRVNAFFMNDENGCFETVNELKEGVNTLHNKTENVQYLDTFLLESDSCSSIQKDIEKKRALAWKQTHGEEPIAATTLYAERLELGKAEAERLFEEGIAWRVVYSGAKSYHTLIRVKDSPIDLAEYKWLHAYLCSTVSDKLTFDPSTQDPARLTRSPVTLTRSTTNADYKINIIGTQELLYEDSKKVYNLNWRPIYKAWLERPLAWWETKHNKKLVPTKPEYKQGMQALLEGTFWTDEQWDGRRQDIFFPAYRLLRSLGYTHNELWSEEGILKGLEDYKKSKERGYWLSREYSPIIAQIDGDYEDAE